MQEETAIALLEPPAPEPTKPPTRHSIEFAQIKPENIKKLSETEKADILQDYIDCSDKQLSLNPGHSNGAYRDCPSLIDDSMVVEVINPRITNERPIKSYRFIKIDIDQLISNPDFSSNKNERQELLSIIDGELRNSTISCISLLKATEKSIPENEEYSGEKQYYKKTIDKYKKTVPEYSINQSKATKYLVDKIKESGIQLEKEETMLLAKLSMMIEDNLDTIEYYKLDQKPEVSPN